MKIHEYQAKDILAKYGVAVPHGEVANTLDEALEVAKRLFSGGAKGVVVKAQIHAGGRGKGGGVKVAKTIDEAQQYAEQILGMQLVTHQTGPLGQKVQRLLIEETAAIDRELYLGIVLDRKRSRRRIRRRFIRCTSIQGWDSRRIRRGSWRLRWG
jgi:succinyl-CoA synthetase beta subunit